MAPAWGLVAAALGMALSGLLRRSPRALQTTVRWVRRVSAFALSAFAVAFAAGAIGAMVQGDTNPKLIVLVLGTAIAAWLLWRQPERHLGVGGYWLAGAWLIYSAVIGGRGPMAGLFMALALPALFTAGAATGLQRDPDQGSR